MLTLLILFFTSSCGTNVLSFFQRDSEESIEESNFEDEFLFSDEVFSDSLMTEDSLFINDDLLNLNVHSLEMDYFCRIESGSIHAFVPNEYKFVDIGTPESLSAAKSILPK